MGKMSIVIVVGLVLIGNTINRSKNAVMDNLAGHEKRAASSQIAYTGVNKVLRSLDSRDTSMLNALKLGQTVVRRTEFGGGVCSVWVARKSSMDSLVLTARGRYMDSVKVIKTVLRTAGGFSDVTGAIAVSYDTKAGIKAGASDTIDGRNHDVYGNLDTNTCSSVAGISYGAMFDTTYTDIGDAKVKGKGPIEPNIEYNPFQPDYTTRAQDLIPLADTVLSTDVATTVVLGTVSNPKIVYATGDIKMNSDVSGAGILIVGGNLNVKKTLKWVGLVIVVGDGKNAASINTLPGSYIYGAVVMSGLQAKMGIGGTIRIYYSCQGLNVLNAGGYKIASWYE